MRALNVKLFRELRNLKFQTLSIAIIVTGGLALLIASWSSYQSLKNTRQNFYDTHFFADFFAEFKRAPEGLVRELQNLPGISLIEGRIVMEGLVHLSMQDEPAVMRMVSIPSGKNSNLNKIFLRKGRFPIESEESEAVIHEGFARAHSIRPGDEIQILVEGHFQKIRIVGIGTSPEYIYAISSVSVLPDDLHYGVLWIPHKTLARLSNRQDSINSISGLLSSGANPAAVLAELDRALKKYGCLGAYLRHDQISHKFLEDELAEQKGTAIITPVIFLSVAAFLIHVIFSRLISLNRSQIATLKAMGFSNGEVARHYLQLVVLMILTGIVPGILIGIWVGKMFAKIYLDFYHFPELKFSLSLSALVVGVLAGLLPGILGAWQSIRRAFLLVPAEAMRPPTPPNFQKTFFDKFAPKNMRPVNKIILRNMFHRPDRLIMITLGMATALGILVTALAWGGMVTQLLETQFQYVQREDMALSFLKPITQNGLQELKKMDGVIAVEGYRTVPIRIRHLNHKKELAITGRPLKAEMRQLLDKNNKKIPLPENGLLLGRYFMRNWNLRPGDVVQIEILEGKQKIFNNVVSGFSDELFGQSATMNLKELSDILDEEPAYNQVMVKADPKKINQLYVELRNIPQIGSVLLKNSMYRGFQNTMGNIIEVSTFILIAFALAISTGVIYNSIRVNFSERSWEMASLEVMGLSKVDVFTIIFMEVSLQVLVGIIPGCLFGYWITVITLSGIHTETFDLPVIIHAESYAKGIIFVVLTLLGCSLIVYRMIDRLSLVDALKSRE